MRFELQYVLVFAVIKNVVSSIILNAENITNYGSVLPEIPIITSVTEDTPDIQNTTNTSSTEVREMNILNDTVAQTPDTQNTTNITATVLPDLNFTKITVAEIPTPKNATNVTHNQVLIQNIVNVTMVEIPETLNTTYITVTEVPGINILNVTIAQTPESENTTNIIAVHVLGLNITNVTVAPIPIVTLGAEVLNVTDVIETQVTEDHDVTNATVVGSFVKSELVPDVIPVAPTHLVNVVFPSGRNVTLGNKLAPTQVKDMPEVSWKANSKNFYTLIVVDPDLPSRKKPIFRSILHWCVVNIPGDNVVGGETLAEYIGAGPPEKSGVHRLTYLVYKQPGIIRFDEIRLSNATSYGRNSFSVAEFALKYNLSNPVAGNFYKTFYDHYVPILYKMLGLSNGNPLAPENIVIATLVLVFWNKNVFV